MGLRARGGAERACDVDRAQGAAIVAANVRSNRDEQGAVVA